MKKKIQSKLETIAHPEIWRDEDWLELRWVEDDGTFAALHKKQRENIQVGVSTKHEYWVDIMCQLKI